MSEQNITVRINGTEVTRAVPTHLLLVDFLRNELNFTGTKEACGVGVCGLCTVWMDGQTISSCILPAVAADGSSLYTAEGLQYLQATGQRPENGPDLMLWNIVQQAFVECEGMQCGICTPGQVMSALALLTENPKPEREEIVHFMTGNLCRCTGYQSIVRAIEMASERWEQSRAAI
jgi:carbon-monoxide dehydrogenase small subunit